MCVVLYCILRVCNEHKVERDGLGAVVEIEQIMEDLLKIKDISFISRVFHVCVCVIAIALRFVRQ